MNTTWELGPALSPQDSRNQLASMLAIDYSSADECPWSLFIVLSSYHCMDD